MQDVEDGLCRRDGHGPVPARQHRRRRARDSDMINAAIDAADQMRDLSIRTGASTETLSKWAYAARQTGTDIEGLSRGLKLPSKNATEALDPKSQQAGLFKALGVSPATHCPIWRSWSPRSPTRSKAARWPAEAAVAMELFGKSGSDPGQFLDQGSKGLDEFGDKAERLGIVISSQTADAADKFKDDLDDLKSASMGLAMQVAGELLPVLDDIIEMGAGVHRRRHERERDRRRSRGHLGRSRCRRRRDRASDRDHR